MRIKLIIYSLIAISLSSCIDKLLGERYVRSVKNAQRNIEDNYQVSGLFNHFPKSISNKSFIRLKSCIPNKTFDSESVYSAYLFLFLNMEDETNGFYPDTFLYKTNYQDLNFIIDDSFGYFKHYDKTKVRNVVQKGKYPIPYFENFDFGLGFERTDLRESGILLINDKYNVPEDLEVYVLNAKNGCYWEIEFDQYRPESLGEWKNGYSSGIAISEKSKMVVYWMIAW